MFDLQTRKEYTRIIVDSVSQKMLCAINNRIVCGRLLVIIHTIMVGYIIFNLITQEINIKYYVCTIIWVVIIYLNYYFNGCILSKIEKEIFQDKMWNGPISVLVYTFCFNGHPSKTIMNNFIKFFMAAPVSIAMIMTYIYNENPIAIFLVILFLPLIFIHPQFNIFDYFTTQRDTETDPFEFEDISGNCSRVDNNKL